MRLLIEPSHMNLIPRLSTLPLSHDRIVCKEYLKLPGALTLKNRFRGRGAYQYSSSELRRDLCDSQSLPVIVISASYLNNTAESQEPNRRVSLQFVPTVPVCFGKWKH
jgi:hypothetical protein